VRAAGLGAAGRGYTEWIDHFQWLLVAPAEALESTARLKGDGAARKIGRKARRTAETTPDAVRSGIVELPALMMGSGPQRSYHQGRSMV